MPTTHLPLIRFLLAFLGALLPAHLHASEGPPPVLHITTYRSASGEFALTVDPTRLHGGGPGSYRVEKNNQLVWEKQLDFTFWEAAITDDGVSVGYAYSSGWRGFDGNRDGDGDIIVAILNPDGSTRFIDRRPRDQSRMMDSPPEPTASGCFLDEASHRFVVRFRPADFNKHGERWETYSITDAKRLDDLNLSSPPVPADATNLWYLAVDARAVPGTSLALITWCRWQWNPRQVGVRFSLVDLNAREIWNLERPAEFAGIERFSLWDLKPLKLLPITTPQGFSFRSPADQSLITFSVTRAEKEPNGWLVRETARAAEKVSTDLRQDPSPPLQTVKLAPRGVLALKAANNADAQPLNVFEFDFDAKGRIGFVPPPATVQPEFLLYAPDGKLAKRIPLAGVNIRVMGVPRPVCIGDDKWILVGTPFEDNVKVAGFALDANTETVTPFKDFDCPQTFRHNITGAQGRFAVLGDYRDNKVDVFDHTGKKLWSLPNPVFSSQDIAFNSRGELGALGNIRNELAVYDADAKLLRTIHLDSTLGQKPNYVSGLAGDTDGGWILHDFNGHPSIYRLDPDGKVLAKFTPRFPDGREFSLYGNVKRAPDGRLWTSDSASLLRLTDDGVVDFIIGRKPDTSSLGEIRCATFDSQGNLYAVDAHNASVHVFDPQGKLLRILKPDPKDFTTTSGLGAITVAGDGAVYYLPATHSMNGHGYLRINADGSRVGFQDGISGEVADEWYFRPASQERLVLGYERAFLTDAAGAKIKTIERRADRRWLDNPDAAAFAPDGSFIILASPSSWIDGESTSVTCFSPAGDALKTFELPKSFRFPRGATNAKTIVVTSGAAAVVIDIATGEMKLWTLPPETEKSWWDPHISPDGSELWCIDNAKKSVFRFAMP